MLSPKNATRDELQHIKGQIVDWLDEDLCDVKGMDIMCAEVGLAELRLLDAWRYVTARLKRAHARTTVQVLDDPSYMPYSPETRQYMLVVSVQKEARAT